MSLHTNIDSVQQETTGVLREERLPYQANTSGLGARLWDVFVRTYDLGFTCFGGPPVHFQIFHRKFVDGLGKTPWIDEQTVTFKSTITTHFLSDNYPRFSIRNSSLYLKLYPALPPRKCSSRLPRYTQGSYPLSSSFFFGHSPEPLQCTDSPSALRGSTTP